MSDEKDNAHMPGPPVTEEDIYVGMTEFQRTVLSMLGLLLLANNRRSGCIDLNDGAAMVSAVVAGGIMIDAASGNVMPVARSQTMRGRRADGTSTEEPL